MGIVRSQNCCVVTTDVVTYIRFAHELVRHNVARPEHSGLVVRRIRSLRPDEHRDRIPQSGTGKTQCVHWARKPEAAFHPDASGLRFPRATLCAIALHLYNMN